MEKEFVSLPKSRHLAQRLLTYEVAGENSGPAESAAFRVCERLRQPLITLAGVAGFRSLLSRALTLARAEARSASAVRARASGALRRQADFSTRPHARQASRGGDSPSRP